MKKILGTCPKKVQYSVMIDEDLVNMLDQMHLVTNRTRSDIINEFYASNCKYRPSSAQRK